MIFNRPPKSLYTFFAFIFLALTLPNYAQPPEDRANHPKRPLESDHFDTTQKRHPKKPPPLSSEDRNFLKTELPEFLEIVDKTKELMDSQVKNKTSRKLPPPPSLQSIVYELRYLKQHDKEAFEEKKQVHIAESKSLKLALEIRTMPKGKEREKAKSELLKLLEHSFDLKVKREEKEAQRLQQALKEFQAKLEKRKSNRNTIIKNRYNMILGEDDSLHW